MNQARRIWMFIAVGIAAGFLSGVFGVGGGILVVPGLIMVARMDQRLAHGTSLAAILPISFASLITYWGHQHVDWPVAMWLTCGAVIGSIIGTRLLVVASKRTLGLIFASVLIVSAIRLFIATQGDGRDELHTSMVLALIAIGLVTGAIAGLLGVGGGAVLVPAMVVLFGLPSVIAKGTSLAVIVPTSIMGTIRNRSVKNVDLLAAMIVGCAGILSAVAGGFISVLLSDTVSNVLFAILLIAIAARLVVQQLRTPAT
ncbi:MAG: sulfite exporter TauE/SafE family protein [Ilumatobacteraceae bacterium]